MGEPVERGIAQLMVGHVQNLVEIAALVIIERKVEIGFLEIDVIDETSLIEAHVRLAEVIELLHILLADETKAGADLRMADQSKAGRVSTDGGDVGTQCFHRTTHSHVTGCAVEILV